MLGPWNPWKGSVPLDRPSVSRTGDNIERQRAIFGRVSLPSFALEACRLSTMTMTTPTVIVIDDDAAMREALGGLFRSVGFQAKLLASVGEFLKPGGRPEGPACLVLDVRLPGQSGFDLQRELAARHVHFPIVFITGHGDIPMSVRAMKGGAIEFLT